jgi:endonuclease-8
MPEGPTLYILKELTRRFVGKKIHDTAGNAGIDMTRIAGKTVKDIRTWGKQYFISLKDVHIRIHLLMFGSYSINEQIRPDKSVRLKLSFKNDTLFFYTCAVKLLDDIEDVFDWKADVMSDLWDPKGARKKLKAVPEMMVCDALLDQQIFSGAGNIIKNEVLYRIQLHPESLVGNLPPKKLSDLIEETRKYSFDFLEWKKQYVLRKHWLAHTKRTCKRCDVPLIKKYCGKTQRRTFFCEKCQARYGQEPGS